MSPSCPCALLLARGRALTTAQRSTGAAAGVNGQGEGAAVASRRELALIVVVQEFCGCSGSLRKELSTAHPSSLTAEVGITTLKPSDTRSFNRGEKKPTILTEELVLIKGKDNNKYF